MAACWGGNNVGLKTGDQISVYNLLYGVLLRSTNDTCIAIAQHFGKVVFDRLGYGEKEVEEITSYFWNYHPNYIKYFLHSMNMVAKGIGLTDSYFDSPCGSESNIYNISTARDMCLLADAVMSEPELRLITSCRQHCCDPVDRKSFSAKPWQPSKK
jgi:D-alanyl-D-alanine carboxypeptidase